MADFTINILGDDINGNHQIGETVAIGDLLYLGTDSRYYLASASAKSTSTTELLMALEAGVADDFIDALAYGYFEAYPYSVLIPGTKYYISTVDGRITTTLYTAFPNVARYIGTAHDSGILFFNPDQTFVSDSGYQVNNVPVQAPLIAHTHTESEVTDLDKYTQAEVNALISTATDNNYVHVQGGASASWVINHALGKQYPAVQCFDGSWNRVIGDITFTDANNLTVTFNTAFAGQAHIN